MTFWERRRLRGLSRYTRTRSPLLGKFVELTDPFWYLFSYDEIFRHEIYRFTAKNDTPHIIDCGANIGMSLIYFKHLYPKATIIAFEPDKEIFQVLRTNMKTFRHEDIELVPKAVWSRETELAFQPDGSVGGRVVRGQVGSDVVRTETVRLKDFLKCEVDFLKIDIEGSEYEVLQDCRDDLHVVDYIFVEYHGLATETQTLQEILKILQSAGFRYHLRDALPIQHPFIREERLPVYDLQLNIFGFRN